MRTVGWERKPAVAFLGRKGVEVEIGRASPVREVGGTPAGCRGVWRGEVGKIGVYSCEVVVDPADGELHD